MDIDIFHNVEQHLSREEIKYAYVGWGEAAVNLVENNNLAREKILIFRNAIPTEMRNYFYQGIGEGMLEFFQAKFNDIVTHFQPLIEVSLFELYLKEIIPKNYIDDFIRGFLNKNRWLPIGYQLIDGHF
jgi:hypothetical protein